jgi:hypothetical protein
MFDSSFEYISTQNSETFEAFVQRSRLLELSATHHQDPLRLWPLAVVKTSSVYSFELSATRIFRQADNEDLNPSI